MGIWNPWRGCHKCSTGCKYCYIHKGDMKKELIQVLLGKQKIFIPRLKKQKTEAIR